MLKPIEKPSRQLVHHPSDVLNHFCHYDAMNRPWRAFDDSVSHQLLELEFRNRRFIRIQPASGRRTTA